MARNSTVLDVPVLTRGSVPAARLFSVEDPDTTWELDGDELTLGSRRDNDIVIRDVGVSRLHARFRRDSEGWTVEDAGSRHGVLVNDERISRHPLERDDEIMIGVVTLRYEIDAPVETPAAAPSGSVWTGRWPKALERVKPAHRRPAAVGAVVAFLLLLMSLSGGDGNHSGLRSPSAVEKQSAHASLVAGEFRNAEKGFRRAALRAPQGQRREARILERIAQLWSAKAKGPHVFRWDIAAETLERARALKTLPHETRTWLDSQQDWVETGRVNYTAIHASKVAATKAQDLLASGNAESAVTTLEHGLAEIAEIPRKGPLAKEVSAQVDALRHRVYAALTQLASARINAKEPNYEAALAFLDRAREHAGDGKARTEVRRLADAARMNRDDEVRYANAVEQLSTRNLDRYEEALALLNQIDPRSMIYQEAQAWGSWAVADTKTRRAEALYAQGHAQDALRLLDEAESAGVDKNALSAIRERRERWSRTGAAYLRGRDLSRAGDVEPAMDALETVLSLEPDPANKYRRQAQELLDHMVSSDRNSQKLTLRRGLRALNMGDYSAANRAFESIRNDPGRRNEDGAVISKAVRQVNAERSLLPQARRTLHVDAVERFEELRDVLTILRRWLGKGDPERVEVLKCLDIVNRRLKNRALGGLDADSRS